MTGNQHEQRCRELCEAIAEEPDSRRLMDLLEALNRLLEERERERTAKAQP
jgi:hypothetical protein